MSEPHLLSQEDMKRPEIANMARNCANSIILAQSCKTNREGSYATFDSWQRSAYQWGNSIEKLLQDKNADGPKPGDVAILPDGTACGTLSLPLPEGHWLYAPSPEGWDNERDVAPDTPRPVLDRSQFAAQVEAAVRWAVRGATMNGKDPDFDPDALVQNAVYALCGPVDLKARHGEKPA